MKNMRLAMELIFGLIGFGLFWYETSGLAALGLYIAMFANNIGHSRKA